MFSKEPRQNANSENNYLVVYVPTHLLLPAKKSKLIIFHWKCLLSMDAVLNQQILAIIQTLFTQIILFGRKPPAMVM
jgi:hypothetical protein